MNIVEIFSLNVLVLLIPAGKNISSYSTRIRHSNCEIDDLKITNCGIAVSRFGIDHINAAFNSSCKLKNKTFTFHFGKVDHYSLSITQRRSEVKISAMKRRMRKQNKVFVPGTHYIFVHLTALNSDDEKLSRKTPKCNFYVVYENATAILGDTYRNVMNGTEFKVDGRRSINNDFERENFQLRYRWNCTDDGNFCRNRDLGKDPTVIVGKEYVIDGKKFQFQLQVRTVNSQWKAVTQYISVDSSRPFSVNCVENCGSGSTGWNPHRPPALLATCQYSCGLYNLDNITAVVMTEEGNRTIENIAIQPSILMDIKSKKEYVVLVKQDKEGVEEILGNQTFVSLSEPFFENCKTHPSGGNTLTKFGITCQYNKTESNFFVLEIISQNNTIFETMAEHLDFFEFIAPVDTEIIITLYSHDQMENSQRIKMNIKPLEETTKSVEEYARDLYEGNIPDLDSVQMLMKWKDYSSVIQSMDFIVRELSKLKSKSNQEFESILKVKRFLINTLNEIPIESFPISLSMSGILKMLFEDEDIEADLILNVSLMEICRSVSESQVYMMEDDQNKDYEESDIKKIAHNLFACVKKGLRNDYELARNSVLDIDITTNVPLDINLSENNMESYPEYISDDILEQVVNNIIKESENGIEICRNMADSLKFIVSNYKSGPTYIEESDKVFGVIKFKGKSVEYSKFDHANVSFIPSPSLKTVDAVISVMFCIYETDPFWAASENSIIQTEILDISLRNMNDYEKIKDFGEFPSIITFNVIKVTEAYEEYKVSVNPVDWNLGTDENELNIVRIEVKAKQSFCIEYTNLDDFVSLQAVVTVMERPTFEHFSQFHTITRSDNKLFIQNEEYEDTWYFLAMTIAQRMSMQDEIDVTFIVYTPRCVNWNFDQNLWEVACPADSASTNMQITCRCSHFSTFAGSLIHNKVDEIPKFIAINFTLVKRGELCCLITVCIIIMIYFSFLMLSVRKGESKEDRVYFLADVPCEYLYGYLIEATTGRRLYSGTSSLIMIQLFGTHGKSKEHVLNFPDPCLELLQRKGRNLFVLGTHEYLGQLVKINVWTDCTGLYPNWYCEEIKVCDLQIKKWWIFKMDHWLRLDGRSPCIFRSVAARLYTSESTSVLSKKTRIFKLILNIINVENTIWKLSTTSMNPRFGYPKRLTVLLSMLLTLMTITTSFYGSPEFLARDTITDDCFFIFSWRIVYIGLFSSIITFFPHMGLVLAFQNSETFEKKKLKTTKSLPPIFNLVIWGVIIANIILQIHLLIIWSYWFVYPVSWQWLASSSISLIFCLFFLEHLWNVFLCLVRKVQESSKFNYRRILINVEKQRHYLYSHFGSRIYRPIMTNFYTTLTKFEYMKTRIKFLQNRRVIWQFQDLVLVLFFIIFLYAIVMENKDTKTDFFGHKEVVDLINGFPNSKLKFSKVITFYDLEDYMYKILIRNVQSYEWYGRYVSESPGMTVDKSNRYLGIIRLHQHRVKESSCEVPEIMQYFNRTCKLSSYLFQEDTSSYSPNWKEKTEYIDKFRQASVWFYTKDLGRSYFGSVGFYGKGGYFAYLGRNIRNSLVNFEYLRRQSWLDVFTRAVIVEVPLYNVNTNFFHFIVIVIERTSAGYLKKKINVHTMRIMKGSSRNKILFVVCTLSFIVLIISFVIRVILRLIRTNDLQQVDLCHIFNIVLACLGLSWIIMYFRKIVFMEQFANEIVNKRNNEFVEYFDISENVFAMRVITSILIFLCTIRLFIILRFARIFRVVKRTLSLSFTTFTYTYLYYLLFFTAFAGISFVLIGSKNESFKNGYENVENLILLSIGHKVFNVSHLKQLESGLEYLLVVMFYLVSFFFSIAFLAILVVNYITARQFPFEERTCYTFKDCAIEKVRNMKRLAMSLRRKLRLNAGAKKSNGDEMVTPKTDDIRYRNCVRVDSNRMSAMNSVAKCVLTKRKKNSTLGEETYAQMLKTFHDLSNRKEGTEEYFFIEHTEDRGCVFVDDRRIVQMENIVKKIVQSDETKVSLDEELCINDIMSGENNAKLQELNYKLKLMLQTINNIDLKVISK